MKKLVLNILIVAFLALASTAAAQNKNQQTVTRKIYGNCGMCKTTIEKAGTIKNESAVIWDISTKIATITYDSKKTTPDAILKRIALAGYDNEQFLAPDDVYSKLHGCCQYEREAKTAIKIQEIVEPVVAETPTATSIDLTNHDTHTQKTVTETQKVNQLQPVFESYFAVKDAMVQSNGSTTAAKAKQLLKAIQNVDMSTLATEEHTVWMKVVAPLKKAAQNISATTAIETQRMQLDALSKNMRELAKVATVKEPIYYQHCPMANDGKGANWLSLENEIKNPYYGSKMMKCGKTVETIK